MKKIIFVVFAVLLMSGIASQASANPGWSHDRRPHDPDRYERQRHQQPFDHHQYRRPGHPDQRWISRRPVVVHRAPVVSPRPIIVERVPVPPAPVVNCYDAYAPGFAVFLPHFSIVIR